MTSTSLMASIGWIGVVIYVVAYGLLSIGRLSAHTNKYHFLNAVGGLCLVIHALHNSDMPDLTVNLIWILIAGTSIARISFSKKETKVLRSPEH